MQSKVSTFRGRKYARSQRRTKTLFGGREGPDIADGRSRRHFPYPFPHINHRGNGMEAVLSAFVPLHKSKTAMDKRQCGKSSRAGVFFLFKFSFSSGKEVQFLIGR